MFDISWTEFLLIGIVALIVIGPKELPTVMRTMGQWTRKVRSMAADFQNQFHEAMREAEMADLKKQVDDIAQDVKNYDPLRDVRSDVEAIGKDLNASLGADPGKDAGKDAGKDFGEAPQSPMAIAPVEERPLPQAAGELQEQVQEQAGQHAVAGAATQAPASEAAPEKASSESAGHAE
jgi:sec-independent protein translocase protein TatB